MIPRAWSNAFTVRDARSIQHWAHENVTLHPPLTITGKFDTTDSRHFDDIFAALRDDHVREVNVLKPVRSGGTLIADVWLPWIIENDPGAFLGIFQTDQIAREHCELRTRKILESIPAIAEKFPRGAERSKDRTQEILFAHMPVFIHGPVLSGLQSKGFRYLWLDEPWLYKKGVIGEAKGRLGDFVKQGLDKLLCTSQGGYAQDVGSTQTADWFQQFNSGELNEWVVQCIDCGRYQVPEFGKRRKEDRHKFWGIVWDDHRDERGLHILSKTLPTVRFECQHCGHIHLDSTRVKAHWNRTGRYEIVGEQKRRKKSFHWPGTIYFPWDYLVEMYLTARNAAALGDRSLTTQFWLKQIANFHDMQADDDYETITPVEIESNALDADIIEYRDPKTDEKLKFADRQMMIDVQMRELYLTVDAWSATGDDLTLWAGKVTTWDDAADVQKKWKVQDQNVGVDINYDFRKQDVAQECCRRGHFGLDSHGNQAWFQWVAYVGNARPHFPYKLRNGKEILLPYARKPRNIDPCPNIAVSARHPDMLLRFKPDAQGPEIVQPKLCRVYDWSEPTISDILDARKDGRAKGIRSLIIPGDWNDVFSRHMGAEKWAERKDRLGNIVRERVKTRADHLRDCKKMSIVHAIRCGRLNIPNGENEK